MEADGLVTHAAAGGRKVYEITGVRAELEQRATILLAEVRRLARQGSASAERVRAAGVVLETALDQVRRLLR